MPIAFLSRREWLAAVPFALSAEVAAKASPRTPAESRAAGRVYNVCDYGAIGDARTLNTQSLQRAIDACSVAGGGTVLVPAGVFLIGTTALKSNVTLHIEAGGILRGSSRGEDYHAVGAVPLSGDSTLNDGNWALLYAVDAKNLCIEGPGTIDGQGREFRSPGHGIASPSGLDGSRRPYHLLLYRCERVTIRNLDLVDGAYHSVRMIQSARLNLADIYIHNRVNVNNDGFHFISCRHVAVNGCIVLAKDDACALFGSCQFVTIANSIFSTRWSVFRFGGGHVRNVAVSNCILFEVYGCPIKVQGNPGSSYENVSFSNIVLDDVTGPIHIGAGPGVKWDGAVGSHAEPLKEIDPSTGADEGTTTPAVVRNFSFSNITGTVTTSPPRFEDEVVYPGEAHSCIAFNCVGGATIENITLEHIHLTFGGGGSAEEGSRRDYPQFAGEYFLLGPLPAYGLFARNIHGLTLANMRVRVAGRDLRPAIVLDTVKDAVIQNLSVDGDLDAECVIRIRDGEDILLATARVLTQATTFLLAEGEGNRNIHIHGADLSKVLAPARFASPSAERAVVIRALS